jgi:Kef-type K+ transport system membrane component KefB
MVEMNSTLLVLLIILSLSLIVPEMFKRLRLPFVTIIIAIGALFGPNGLNYVQSNDTIAFFGFLGMAFLMLMTGIETDLSKIRKNKRKIAIMSAFNGLIPFLVGFFIMRYFGYSLTESILVGIIFISSSVAIISPTLKHLKIFSKEVGQLILASVLIADIVSLIALGIILQNISPITLLSVYLYFPLLLISLVFLFYFAPKLSRYVLNKRLSADEGQEKKFRFVILIVIGFLAYFSVLGVHSILASFLVGIMLSGIIKKDHSEFIYSKFHTISYGLFVPVFFFIVGMQMDLSLFKNFDLSKIVMPTIIIGLIASKFISGYLGGRLAKLKKKDSITFGSISIVQLTTTLAVTYTAVTLGALDNVIATSIILLSIISVVIGPLITTLFVGGNK